MAEKEGSDITYIRRSGPDDFVKNQVFRWVHPSVYEGVSVGRSVGQSVGPSAGRSVTTFFLMYQNDGN